jgi:hypothetical protein
MAEIIAKKVSDLTVDELKSLIHETISEDIEAWRETLEIMGDKKLMRKIKKADDDWDRGKEDAYILWDKVKE